MQSDDHANAETERLLQRYRGGDRAALEQLLARCRERMRRFVELRMDHALRARLDASDVVQEAQLELARRLDDFLARAPMPFDVWVCKTSYENLLRLRRQHAGAAKRAVHREAALPEASSLLLAQRFQAPGGSPLSGLVQAEMVRRVEASLSQLGDADREMILLRTFEGLNNQEVAQVLDLEPDTASKRYGRALIRMRQALAAERGPSPSE